MHKARGVEPAEISLGIRSDVICGAGLVLFLFPVENSRAQHSPLLPPPHAFTAVAQDQGTVPPQTSDTHAHTHTQQKAEALVRTVLSYSLSLAFVLVFHKHPLFLPPSFFLLTPDLSHSLSLSQAEVGVAAAGLLPVTQLYAVLMELLRDANTA